MLICGVDEAGRGSVLGSLVISAVIINDSVLENICVTDSKKLTKKKRDKLDFEIRENAVEVNVVEFTATDINNYHRSGLTLNQIEVLGFAKVLNGLNTIPDKIYLDAADVSEQRFRDNVLAKYIHDVPLIAKHKADIIYPIVSAASIIAKVYRDKSMLNIAPVSGYCDKKTIEWLTTYYNENGNFPKDARYFWKTLNKIKYNCNTNN